MFKIAHDAAVEEPAEPELVVDLDELCRIAATQMLAVALEAERRVYLEAHAGVLDEAGRRVVVGNGHA
ncbi:MAG: IS256 family transposase, partial [Actinomycetota bacterium]